MLSKELRKFLEKWLFEVKYVEPRNFKIARWDTGLCGCVVRYTYDAVLHEEMLKELDSLFKKHGLDEIYPFGRGNYQGNYRNSSFHKCPTRIKFVEDVLFNDCWPRKVLNFIKKLFDKQFNNFTSIEFGMLCVGARFWFGGVEFIKISSNKLSYTNACQYKSPDEETVFGETEIVYVKREN